jgi:hypothetical protein
MQGLQGQQSAPHHLEVNTGNIIRLACVDAEVMEASDRNQKLPNIERINSQWVPEYSPFLHHQAKGHLNTYLKLAGEEGCTSATLRGTRCRWWLTI